MKFFFKTFLRLSAFFIAGICHCACAKAQPSAMLVKENIFEGGKFFNSCHASTLIETEGGGLLAAYFAGTKEGADDVCIWISRYDGAKWMDPKKTAWSAMTSGKDEPCWNPVLFRLKSGRIILFFKQGGNWKNWQGMQSFSDDEGETWTTPEALKPEGNAGPIKNKPVYVGERIIAPTSDEPSPADWRVYFWISDDGAKTWRKVDHLNREGELGGIQPSILIHKDGSLQALGRTPRGAGYVYQAWSRDGGETWSKLCATPLPNQNSGTDALTLADGRHIIVYNHQTNWKKRSPLNVAISDDGLRWFPLLVLEDAQGEFSYPAVIQRLDGRVEISYTNRRKTITHVTLDPKNFSPGKRPITGAWSESAPERDDEFELRK